MTRDMPTDEQVGGQCDTILQQSPNGMEGHPLNLPDSATTMKQTPEQVQCITISTNCGKASFKVDRSLLQLRMPHFQALGCTSTAGQQRNDLYLAGVAPEVCQLLLEWINKGSLPTRPLLCGDMCTLYQLAIRASCQQLQDVVLSRIHRSLQAATIDDCIYALLWIYQTTLPSGCSLRTFAGELAAYLFHAVRFRNQPAIWSPEVFLAQLDICPEMEEDVHQAQSKYISDPQDPRKAKTYLYHDSS